MVAKDLKNHFIINAFRSRLILIICCAVCYIYGVRNDYALDDDFAFYQNAYVQEGIKGIPDILTHPYYNQGDLSFDYRPIAGITFAIEKQLSGNDPHISHFVNLVLYTICVLLVFGLLTEVFLLDIPLALIIALFFAVHPAHTEVVASIKNREEILSTIFCLLVFFCVHRSFVQKAGMRRAGYIILALVFVLLSFLSKLTTLPMVGIIAAMLYFQGFYRRRAMFAGILCAMALVSLAYSWQIFHMANRPIYDLENPLTGVKDISIKLGTTLASLWFYFRYMFLPYPFSFFYGYNTIPLTTIDQPIAVLSFFIHAGLLVYGILSFFRKKIVGLFILSYFMAISVYSNIVMVYTGIVSERALFFPSLWFIAAICTWLYQYANAAASILRRQVLIGAAAILLIVYGVLDINRVHEWRNTIALMGADVQHLDNSALANYFYASVLKVKAEEQTDTTLQNNYLSESKKYYYITNTIAPGYPYGYFRLGQIYRYDRYTPDSAYYYFKKAYRLNPSLTEVDYQYGRTEYEFGDINTASQVFAGLYQKLPYDTFTIFYRAMLLLKTGHPAEGHQVNAVMMKMAPTYYQPYYNEGLYYQLAGDAASAAKNYETAVGYGCTDQGAYRFLAGYYQKQGRTDEANKFMKLLQ
jgi:hypothetical protein